MNTIRSSIEKLVEKRDFDPEEAEDSMRDIMSGEASPSQIGSFLTALRIKGETPTEIASFARVMRNFASTIDPEIDETLVDTCGTGGDDVNTFNISTSAMFVAAGAGVPIAKHGNRSVTSKSGSADVLESLGVNIEASPKDVENNIEDIGIGFMFAPNFHEAMRHAIGPREDIGLRTVFNVLGPLTNPAGADAQLMGVYDASLTEKMARVLKKLDCERALVVHGMDGLDEISTVGKTKISKLSDGEIKNFVIGPEEIGIDQGRVDEISGGDCSKNARIMLDILKGKSGPMTDIVLLNAAAAVFVGGKAEDLEEGVEMARESINSGAAYEKLVQLVKSSGGNMDKLTQLEDCHEYIG